MYYQLCKGAVYVLPLLYQGYQIAIYLEGIRPFVKMLLYMAPDRKPTVERIVLIEEDPETDFVVIN